jgi:hypothetical protein
LPGAFSELIRLTEQRYSIEYTIIDLNPGLSSINQNLFLVSDAFIIPTNPDPFSLMALDTLTMILPRWATWKKSAIELFADSAYPLPEGTPKFVGTLIQRFNIRKGRAATPYRDNIAEIKIVTANKLVKALEPLGLALSRSQYGEQLASDGFCLAEIPDFQGLLPKSFDAGVPVFELTDAEMNAAGPVLAGMQVKRQLFQTIFEGIALKVIEIMQYT